MSAISSPLIASMEDRPRRVKINSKHATPELTVLEGAVAELNALDEFGLLPAAAIDVGSDPPTPTTALPATPEEGENDATDVLNCSTVATSVCPEGWYDIYDCETRDIGNGNHLVIPITSMNQALTDVIIRLWCWVQPNEESGFVEVLPTCDGVEGGASLPGDCCCIMTPEIACNLGLTPDQVFCQPVAPSYEEAPMEAPTAFQVCGLPASITQEDFLEFLDREEASGLYDFVFLPSTSGPSGSKFAVVNCISHAHAMELCERLSRRTFWGRGQTEEIILSWTKCQGLECLIDVCRDAPENAEDMDDKIRPQLFSKGFQVEMPPRRVAAEATADASADSEE
mmetsp:Transcript_67625/g.141337  ORF Transcript_67625/g.141337 Transcript_67625/m.141337 type:complete len:341 (-) Transcript_67625:872-1894(-)|eukprot:CAMPEP_0206466762 /NCGR_PEP_ID=MMETSP0324_2-20121206/28650_1 /ASSEMBLY_ACC=CAM_ASM_000836 /TAXON_ID=2866 /ORGANISM="Crypthecodinium cohnii, Strain Seligo" /LENGTH=340 /DNA_ID=CAMNT_0053939937 /DNA_START=160 /DNA_END=1182 /DNA_ORIENTATION=+